jgi:acyl carrier protein
MNDEVIYADVKNIIGRIARIDPASITDTVSLRNDLCIDSLLAVQIIAMIEQKYGLSIDEVEIFNVDNVTEVVELIKEYKRIADNEKN